MEILMEILKETKSEKIDRDFRGILSVDDAGDVWLMATTQDCKDCDLFQNGNLFSDNGGDIKESLNVGLYSCRFKPWSHQSYEGGWDGGVDAVDVVLIATAPDEFLMEKNNPMTASPPNDKVMPDEVYVSTLISTNKIGIQMCSIKPTGSCTKKYFSSDLQAERIKRLEDALRFYADEGNHAYGIEFCENLPVGYSDSEVFTDKGAKARAVLEEGGK